MLQSLGTSQASDPSSEHEQRLQEWTKRKDTFFKNAAKLETFLSLRLKLVHLDKTSSFENHGFEADLRTNGDNEMRDSITNSNLAYCKLFKFYKYEQPPKIGKRTSVIRRQYCLTSLSDDMKQTIIEGARMQSYFNRGQMKDAHYFLEIYGVFYHSLQDGTKLLSLMHDPLLPSSLAHKLWNFEVTPVQAMQWTIDLTKAAEWLNLTGVAHRFIRPENVLIIDDCKIRLAGFDVACKFFKSKGPSKGEFKLQPAGLPADIPRQQWDHLPPECFASENYDPQMVDSWSIGVLFCTLLTASHPFDVKKHSTMPQQWKASTERAALPKVAQDDSIRFLLDDIFKPADQRMTTFDMMQDKRLLIRSSKSRSKVQVPYYRIDMHPKRPPPNSSEAGESTLVKLDVSKFNEHCKKIYDLVQDTASKTHIEKMHQENGEEAIYQRTNGTKYKVMRNESFGGQFKSFHNEPFLAAISVDEQGQSQQSQQDSPFLVKIFLLQNLSRTYCNILLAESSKINRYLSVTNSIPALLSVVDIFETRKPTPKMFIFYENDLKISKSLRQMAEERSFKKIALLDSIMRQLANTVEDLFQHGIAHRYLRPEHIFLIQGGTIKVTNLEMMICVVDTKERTPLLRGKGLHDEQEQNWDHLPPECFHGRCNSLLLDVWSFGVVLVFCLTQQIPFQVPHTMDKATDAWNKFKSQNEPALAPYLNLLDRIFQPIASRISSVELADWYRVKLNPNN